jgi:hypothetical protein
METEEFYKSVKDLSFLHELYNISPHMATRREGFDELQLEDI